MYIFVPRLTLQQTYKRFKTRKECIEYLEEVIWGNKPICPYCEAKMFSIMPKEQRYHCKICRSSYSVTVKTMFHKTKIDLQKWFYAIKQDNISVRKLASEICVTKDTASFILTRIKVAKKTNSEIINLLKEIQ